MDSKMRKRDSKQDTNGRPQKRSVGPAKRESSAAPAMKLGDVGQPAGQIVPWGLNGQPSAQIVPCALNEQHNGQIVPRIPYGQIIFPSGTNGQPDRQESPNSDVTDEETRMMNALTFMKKVKEHFEDDMPSKYTEFQDLLKTLKAKIITHPEIVFLMKDLLKGHGDLLVLFNKMLPIEFKMILRPTSFTKMAKLFVAKVKARGEHMYDSFIDLMHMYRDDDEPEDEIKEEAKMVFADDCDLLDEFALFGNSGSYLADSTGTCVENLAHEQEQRDVKGKGILCEQDKRVFKGRIILCEQDQHVDKGKNILCEQDQRVVKGKNKLCEPGVRENQRLKRMSEVADESTPARKRKVDKRIQSSTGSGGEKLPDEDIGDRNGRSNGREAGGRADKGKGVAKDNQPKRVSSCNAIDVPIKKQLHTSEPDSENSGAWDWREVRESAAHIEAGQLSLAKERGRDRKMGIRLAQTADLPDPEDCNPSYSFPEREKVPVSQHRIELAKSVLNDDGEIYKWKPGDPDFGYRKVNKYEEAMYDCEEKLFELDMKLERNVATARRVAEYIDLLQAEDGNLEALPPVEKFLSTVHVRCIQKLYEFDTLLLALERLREAESAGEMPEILSRLVQNVTEKLTNDKAMTNMTVSKKLDRNFHMSLVHPVPPFLPPPRKRNGKSGKKSSSRQVEAGSGSSSPGPEETMISQGFLGGSSGDHAVPAVIGGDEGSAVADCAVAEMTGSTAGVGEDGSDGTEEGAVGDEGMALVELMAELNLWKKKATAVLEGTALVEGTVVGGGKGSAAADCAVAEMTGSTADVNW